MLYNIVLYCIVLYCIVLYCIVLYCIVLYCIDCIELIVLYCIVSMEGFGFKLLLHYTRSSEKEESIKVSTYLVICTDFIAIK